MVQPTADCVQRHVQIAFNIVVEAAQRRNVNALHPWCERTRFKSAKEPIKDRQERSEGLTRSGRRNEQDVLTRRDRRPSTLLREGRPLRKRLLEPGADGSGEQLQ